MLAKIAARSEKHRYCCVKDCASNIESPGVTLFRFPKDAERCSTWLKNCGRSDLAKFSPHHLYNNYKICNNHFATHMFGGSVGSLSQRKLKKTAIPEFFSTDESEDKAKLSEYVQKEEYDQKEEYFENVLENVPNSLTDCDNKPGTSKSPDVEQENFSMGILTPVPWEESLVTSKLPNLEVIEPCKTKDEATQTPERLSWNTPRMRELRLKLKRLQRKQVKMDRPVKRPKVNKKDILSYIRGHFNNNLATFLETCIKLNEKDPRGHRYSQAFKEFALNVHTLGPNAYKYLAKMFNLPSRTTLYRMTVNSNITPGCNNNVSSSGSNE